MFLGDYDTIQAMEKDGSLTEASLFVEMEKQNDKNGNKWLMLGANIALVAAIVVGIAKLQRK